MIDQKDIQAFRDTGRVLLRGNDFIYLLPHQALRRYISNYTVTFPGKGAQNICNCPCPRENLIIRFIDIRQIMGIRAADNCAGIKIRICLLKRVQLS